MEHIFICLLTIFFGEVSVKVFGPFFNQAVFLLMIFKSFSYILENSPLSVVSFTNIFFQFVAYLLILLILHRAQAFNFNEASLSIISFMDLAFGVVSKKSLPYPRSFQFYPMLSFRSFIVFHCTFMSDPL